jgi:hypothetical protein
MPGLDDDLGIAGRNELVSLAGKFLAQFVMIVDGAVEDDAHARHVIDERLMRALAQVHDAEPAVTEASRTEAEDAFTVGSAPRLRGRHFRNGLHIGKLLIEA